MLKLLSGCGAWLLGGGRGILPMKSSIAADAFPGKKLVFIFLGGGNDGINTIIPRGDADYSPSTRPTLFVPENRGIDLGNGFAQLHPALEPLMDVYNHTSLNGRAGPGGLAVIHRVGYPNQSRSHFSSQDFWHKGVIRDEAISSGMLYRQLDSTMDLERPENAFAGVSLSTGEIRALAGDRAFPSFLGAGGFSLLETGDRQAHFVGRLPNEATGDPGDGLLGLYGASKNSRARFGRKVHSTGIAMAKALDYTKIATDSYVAAGGVNYPTGAAKGFQEIAKLLKATPVRMVATGLGSFDNHTSQGTFEGAHPNLLSELAKGIRALHVDLQDQWDNLVIVAMTEFGRTSKENGSKGTDHGESSVMFVAGGGVKGGVYNCDASTWEEGAMFSARGRYLARRTDFRAVFGEIFTRHFGDTREQLEQVIPGYSLAESDYPEQMRMLNFLA